MPLPPVGAGRNLLLPGSLWLSGGPGDPGEGGSRWAVPKSSRNGMGITTSHPAPRPRPALALALLRYPALRLERSDPSLRSVRALLGAPSSPGSFALLATLTSHLHPMMRGEPLAPVMAHLRGPRVECHL